VTAALATTVDVDSAYHGCERITRRAAANFFYGIRLLPRPKRQAMCAVYAFARRVDDIGDGALPPEMKLAGLEVERERLARLESLGGPGGDRDPVLVALVDARDRFDLPVEALADLVDGVELDVRETRYETFDELVVYCRHVAGSIGRLCLAIFGDRDRAGATGLADDLGVAMQLTNILRDVREDGDHGRVYLPAEDMCRFGCEELRAAPPDAVAELVRFEAARARQWFDRGLGLVELLDARSASCVLAMTGIYRCILERIAKEPGEILVRRVSLPAWEKAWLAARSVAGVRV
jgi:15-cis-phytoene synthase